MKKQWNGIALILFGILLCVAEDGLNHTLLRNFSDFPFSLFGTLIGMVGVVFVFRNKQQ